MKNKTHFQFNYDILNNSIHFPLLFNCIPITEKVILSNNFTIK
jgi:hypothetical protein